MDDQLKELKDIEAEATPAPWTLRDEFSQDHGQFCIDGPDGHEIAAVAAWMFGDRPESQANARFIALARNHLPALITALESERAGRVRAEEALDKLVRDLTPDQSGEPSLADAAQAAGDRSREEHQNPNPDGGSEL